MVAANLSRAGNELGAKTTYQLFLEREGVPAVRAFHIEDIHEVELYPWTRTAANSIVLNIAEGSGRGTKKDFSHFLDMALGSTFETVACFFVARRQSYVSQHDLDEMKRNGESLSKRINAFKGTLKL